MGGHRGHVLPQIFVLTAGHRTAVWLDLHKQELPLRPRGQESVQEGREGQRDLMLLLLLSL